MTNLPRSVAAIRLSFQAASRQLCIAFETFRYGGYPRITHIIADVDEATREVILTIHWRGRQHSLRIHKPKAGEY